MTKHEDNRRFLHWLTTTATDAERKLRMTAVEYENRYFQDLTLKDGRSQKKLATCEIQNEGGKWIKCQSDLQLDVTLSQGWIFRYRRLKSLGRCSYRQRRIEIKAGIDGDEFKGTLLHEMIHAYEDMLVPPFREWLLLDIYKRMEKKLGERTLHRYIDTNTHAVFLQSGHGVLFLLKSLQLDERFGWKRGTVFGYGRDDLFNKKEPRA